MTAFIAIGVGFGMGALFGVLVLVPYLCAIATGRALGVSGGIRLAGSRHEKTAAPPKFGAAREDLAGGLELTAAELERQD